ncbi:MAG: hypothetical protein PHQ96_07085 [Candidatus Omnitrophica bacterium]|nr:hypothetical protein [Candidatus Omnitrophota bacterium]
MQPKIKRRNYFIDKKFQTEFILRFSFIVIIASLCLGLFLIYLTKESTTVTIENAHVQVKSTADFIFPLLIQTLLVVTVISALLVALLTLLASHKIAGPLYRIRKELELVKSGSFLPNFHIRKGDQMQDLADSLFEVVSLLRDKHKTLKAKNLELKKIIEANPENKEGIKALINDLENTLDYFKV